MWFLGLVGAMGGYSITKRNGSHYHEDKHQEHQKQKQQQKGLWVKVVSFGFFLCNFVVLLEHFSGFDAVINGTC